MACNHEHLDVLLLKACGKIMAEKAVGWIRHAGYNM